ncbi:DUF4811 domain-containing protein [Lactobacillus sp. PV037]|uniref:DUF4811 domain-containing protein n=1 Tax=unclassified Lactobacillus TaxID=2620435 RepID=UPI00223F974E|nr:MULTISPECIES: DUF4811 domain-containing protein [unclassified Lactobacillus]QNQ82401.1 DUF4811 domain-containing protein [Lactobacillus sp. PV012]QNQ83486.1 DUF4811 domain-containing protein [Lactobacillus sp. PV037]
MIIAILIVAAILFIYFNVISGKAHTLLAWIALIFVGLSIAGITLHDCSHYGMKEKVQTHTTTLSSSASPQLPLLLYQPLGNGTEKIYLYKTSDKQNKPQAIKTDKMKVEVKQGATPRLKITTTRYTYKNDWNKILFEIFGHNNELKERKYTFYVPKNWKVLSVKQAQELQKKMQAQAALMKKKQLAAQKAQK